MSKQILSIFIFLSFFFISCNNDKILISDGVNSNFQIVGDNQELIDSLNIYFKKVNGISLSQNEDNSSLQKIILKKIKSDDQIVSIGIKNRNIEISGSNTEMLKFATYEFIEQVLGVSWLSPNVTHIPKKENLFIEKNFKYLHKPPVNIRTVHSRLFYENDDFADKLKVTTSAFPFYIPEAKVHTFHRFMPEEEFYESNPEYYALNNGKRLPTQLCLTNDKVFDIVNERVEGLFTKYPNYNVISVSQDDNTNYCRCDNCEAIHEEFGGPAASMINFVNRIARNFKDKTISTLAYQYTRKPTKVIPDENVLITLCSIECDRRLPIEDGCKEFHSDLIGWSKLTENIRIWDYTTQFTNFLAPFPNWNTLKENINLFVDNNAKWIFEQHSNHPSELFELRSYLKAKLLWNPKLDLNDLIKKFSDLYYKEASNYIQEYIEDISNEISNEKDFFLFLYGDPSQAFDSFLRPEKVTFYNELFDKALESVKYNQDLTNRVLKARISIDYASLELHRKNNSSEYNLIETNNNIKSPDNDLLNRLERFEKTAKENNITLMNEMGYTVSEYVYYFDKALDLAVKNNIAKYKPVSLLTQPTKYANEDPKVLTDGALGGSSFYSNWLGFVDNNMDAIVDLGEDRFVNSITTSFLQVTNHVVFFPPSVEFLISNDKKKWQSFGKIDNQSLLNKKSKVNDIQVFETNINTNARYVRVRAKNYGDAPYWHHAAGQPSWIFSDEIIIE